MYNHDIAGIGRNDTSSLLQYTGQTANNANDITVNFTGTFSNNQTLVWGNDGHGTGSWSTGNAPSGYLRLSRAWQFQRKNGDPGLVTISIASGAFVAIPGGNLYLIINTGGDSLT